MRGGCTGQRQEVVVGVAALGVSTDGAVVVTHGLGSCVGVAAHDPVSGIGGIVHVMLPDSTIRPERARARPCMFVDTGLEAFFDALERAGADRSRLVVRVAGGARGRRGGELFAIGERNVQAVRRWLDERRVAVTAFDVGGLRARTLHLDPTNGRCWIISEGQTWELP